jgi:hypothetical protein
MALGQSGEIGAAAKPMNANQVSEAAIAWRHNMLTIVVRLLKVLLRSLRNALGRV